MVAIPAATPIIKPQDTLPVKKPIPVAITAKVAKVLPAPPVTILKALQAVLVKAFLLILDSASSIYAEPILNLEIQLRHLLMHVGLSNATPAVVSWVHIKLVEDKSVQETVFISLIAVHDILPHLLSHSVERVAEVIPIILVAAAIASLERFNENIEKNNIKSDFIFISR